MLVLSRKQGESIMIGDDIRVVILEANRFRVQVGVEAPRAISVRRSNDDDVSAPHSNQTSKLPAVDGPSVGNPRRGGRSRTGTGGR